MIQVRVRADYFLIPMRILTKIKIQGCECVWWGLFYFIKLI